MNHQDRHSVTEGSNVWRLAAFLLSSLIVPNLVFAVLAQWVFMQRAWVNIDYLLLAALWAASGLGRRYLFCGVFLVAALDWLFAFAPAYHMSPTTALQGLGGITALGAGFLSLNLLVLLGLSLALAALCVVAMPARTSRGSVAASATLVLALVLLNAGAHSRIDAFGLSVRLPNMATSTLNSLRVSVTTAFGPAQASAPERLSVPSASHQAWQQRRAGEDFIVVHVESLGWLVDDSLRQRLFQPLQALASEQGLALEVGRVAFRGSTVAGELRELCAVDYPTVSPSFAEPWARACLTRRATAQGMHSIAVHGFLGAFFSRSEWYPRLGFDRSVFAPEMVRLAPELARCGSAFEGVCDEAALDYALELLADSPPPTLLYFLSLTAHLPVLPVHDPAGRARLCGEHGLLARDRASCDLLLLHHAFMRTLAQKLGSSLPRPATVVVVGDHPPPFLEAERRALYSQAYVPFLRINVPAAPGSPGTGVTAP